MCRDYGQRPSSLLIPQSPAYLRFQFDEAIWWAGTMQDRALQEEGRERASLPAGLIPWEDDAEDAPGN